MLGPDRAEESVLRRPDPPVSSDGCIAPAGDPCGVNRYSAPRMIAYIAVVGIARALALLPLGLALGLGRGVGSFTFHVLRLRRGVVLGNLRHTVARGLPECEVRAMGAAAYRNFVMTLVEVLRSSAPGNGGVDANVTYDALTPFEDLRRQRRPLVILQGHFGNFDLTAYAFAKRGFPLHTVMKRLNNPSITRLVVETREAHDITVHLKGRDTYAEMREVLQSRGWVGILPDQRPRHGQGTEVRLLGQPARLFDGPALLHLETGAPLCLAFGERDAKDPRHHHVRHTFLESHPPTGDREADVQAIMQRIADGLSDGIRRNPAQYFWFHRLWGKDVSPSSGRLAAPG